MIIYFSIYFILFGFLNMFFIVISSDTKDLNPAEASRMRALNIICVEYIAPYYAIASCILIPTVIVWGV